MRTNHNSLRKKKSEHQDSVYLYHSENKELYNDVLENFNKSDCIFNRNLMAYLENRDEQDDSFYAKHILSCSSCQAKAKEFRKLHTKINESIPIYKINEELLPMVREEVKDLVDLFNHDSNEIERINILKTFKASLSEFFKGFFTSREIVMGFLVASAMVLLILFFN